MPSYPGHRIRLTFQGGLRTRFMSCKLTHTIDYNERNFLGTRKKRRSSSSEDLEIDLEFENSDDFNSSGVMAGQAIQDYELVADDGTVMIHPDILTRFPVSEWQIGEAELNFDSDKDSGVSLTIVTSVDDNMS